MENEEGARSCREDQDWDGSGILWSEMYTIGTRLRSRPPEIATCVVAWLGGC